MQAFGPVTGKKWTNTSVLETKVSKTLLFTLFRAVHFFLTLQKACKWQRLFAVNPAKNTVVYSIVFLFALASKDWYLQCCVCISAPKSTGICSMFCVFAKAQKYCNLLSCGAFEIPRIVWKMCQKRHFFWILGTLNTLRNLSLTQVKFVFYFCLVPSEMVGGSWRL